MQRVIVSLVVAAMLGGCHTMHFELEQAPAAQEVQVRNHYFFWGLVPTRVFDAREKCSAGVVALREETNFLDGLFGIPFLGIWTFRSTTYYCRQALAQAESR